MKIAYTIAALIFAAASGGLGMTSSANAHPVLQGLYCLHHYDGGENFGYMYGEQCSKYTQPMGGWCTFNNDAFYRTEPYSYVMERG